MNQHDVVSAELAPPEKGLPKSNDNKQQRNQSAQISGTGRRRVGRRRCFW